MDNASKSDPQRPRIDPASSGSAAQDTSQPFRDAHRAATRAFAAAQQVLSRVAYWDNTLRTSVKSTPLCCTKDENEI